MPNMPTLGPPPKRNSGGRLLGTLVIVALGFFGYRYYRQHHPQLTQTPGKVPVQVAPLTAADAGGQAALISGQAGAQNPAGAAPAAGPSPAPTAAPGSAGAPSENGPKAISFTLDGALETSLAQKAGNDVAPALAQVLTRTLVWWVQVPSELMRGDKVDLIYEITPEGEPQVDAVSLVSGKYGKTFSAFRFQAQGDAFSRLYEPDGKRLETQLVAPPLDVYEQVTSLLRDGRHHKGVDFKTPVGTPVRATFAGTITRKNWNWRGNGNCLEVTEAAPPHRHALYLHLSPLPDSVRVGRKVARGQVLAESGNTGHSFAPHLHYQLMAANGTKVLDPFDSQKTRRVSIDADQRAALLKEIARLSARMSPAVAQAGAK